MGRSGNKPYVTSNPKYKSKRERCPNCGSFNLSVVPDPPTWPHVECDDCGAYVRDFGD